MKNYTLFFLTTFLLLTLAFNINPLVKIRPILALPSTPPITPPITPTATSTPFPNAKPIIYTNYLYDARLNYSYTGFVRGGDYDINDILTMEVNNLPPGIKLVGCQNYPAEKISYITCRIEGKPTKIGRYNVSLVLKDNHGGIVQKTLPLSVNR